MRLLELGHVDGGQEALAAEQQVGERQAGLGLADAARARPAGTRPCGAVGVAEPGPGGPDPLGEDGEGVVLAVDALACRCFSRSSTTAASSRTILPTGMPVQSETTEATTSGVTSIGISGLGALDRGELVERRPSARSRRRRPRRAAARDLGDGLLLALPDARLSAVALPRSAARDARPRCAAMLAARP